MTVKTLEDELSTAESCPGREPSLRGAGAKIVGRNAIGGQAPRRGPCGRASAGDGLGCSSALGVPSADGQYLGPQRRFETNSEYSSELMGGLAFSISSSTFPES